MEQKILTLRWPTGGVFKRAAFSDTPPQFCFDAQNVRPDETILGRERGGSRPGLVKAHAQQLGSGNPVRLISEVTYDSSGITTRLLASANGSLYFNSSGTLTVISSGVTLASDVLTAVDIQGVLYICGDNTSSRVLCTYTPGTNTLATATATAGTLPTKCKLSALSMDRLFLSGDDTPGVWYASRAGDPLDYDYSEEDALAACSAANTRAGRLSNQPMTALMPHHEGCIIMGQTRGLYVLKGNPKTSGSLIRLSSAVGVHGPRSWCYDAEGWLWFWSQDGLYTMPPGCGDAPISVSRDWLPESLVNVDRTAFTINMAYDFRDRGVHVFCTKNTAGSTTHYFLDTKTWQTGDGKNRAQASFWPMTFQSDHEPFCLYELRDTSNTNSIVMIGSRDGYVRRFQTSAAQDDSSDIASYILIGPIQPGDGYMDGLLAQLIGELASSSGSVTWSVLPGDNAQIASSASARETGTWTAGVNFTDYPRVRGSAFYIKLSNAASNSAWAMERVMAVVRGLGRRRA